MAKLIRLNILWVTSCILCWSAFSAELYLFNKENQNRPLAASQQLILLDTTLSQQEQNKQLAILYFQFNRSDLLVQLLEKNAAVDAFHYGSLRFFVRGFIAYNEGKFETANTFLERAKQVAHKSDLLSLENKLQWVATIEMYLAINNAFRQKYTHALERLRAIKLQSVEQGWRTIAAKVDFYLGTVNYELKDYESALEHYKRSANSYPQQDELLKAESITTHAQMVNIIGDRAEAFKLLNQAIAVFESKEDQVSLAFAYLLKSYFHSKNNDSQKSLEWIAKSVALREVLGNEREVANAYVHYAFELMENDQLVKALSYAKKAVEMSESLDDLSGTWDAYGLLARVYSKTGEYKKAYEFMYKAERMLLKKARLDITNEAARLNSEFNLEQEKLNNQILDMENSALQASLQLKVEKQKQHQLLMMGLIALLALVSVVVVLVYRLYAKNRKLATEDTLTGLHNRRSIMELGSQTFAVSKRYAQNLSVMMLDIDNFKQVNDQYGHKEGDKVLAFIAKVCRNTLRSSDFMGRIGGEEFLVVLPNTSIEEGHQLAERLCHDIHQASIGEDIEVEKITVSVGITQCTSVCDDFSDMVNKADIALYEAKNCGRNQVKRYSILTHSNDSTIGSAIG